MSKTESPKPKRQKHARSKCVKPTKTKRRKFPVNFRLFPFAPTSPSKFFAVVIVNHAVAIVIFTVVIIIHAVAIVGFAAAIIISAAVIVVSAVVIIKCAAVIVNHPVDIVNATLGKVLMLLII